MQRLRIRQRELGVTPETADVVLLGAGCTRAWQRFQQEEEAALQAGRKSKRAMRLGVTGSTFLLMKKVRGPGLCFEPDGAFYYAHLPKDPTRGWVNVPFLTGVHPNKEHGLEPLASAFADFVSRDVLLSFRGTIDQVGGNFRHVTSNLVAHRKHNVRALYEASLTGKIEPTSRHIHKVFWTPGTLHLRDDEEHGVVVSAQSFSRKEVAAHPLEGTAKTMLTYLRSHFCFQPTGRTWR
jgi:hypothetical protein